MSRCITVWLDDDAEKRLDLIAANLGRTAEDFAESAVQDAALHYFTGQNVLSDPAKKAL